MARFIIFLLLAIALVAIALIIAGQSGLLRGQAPSDLGVSDGKLKRPSNTQNSVSSQAALWPEHPQRAYADIAPFKFVNADADATMFAIAKALAAMPNTVIVRQDSSYIYAQSTTALLKFTDDIEFALDAAQGLVHVRSASRLGQKDFGVNRKRVEAIRLAIGQ